VIALAYKRFDGAASAAELRELPRAALEAGLEHGGFAVFQCPLKARPPAAPRSAPLPLLFGYHIGRAAALAQRLMRAAELIAGAGLRARLSEGA
jgi:hypothetical protein